MNPKGWTKLSVIADGKVDPTLWDCLGLQKSTCPVTKEVFVKLIVGKHKDTPVKEIKIIISELREIFRKANHHVYTSCEQPLWMKAEYLENVLDFELHPPCGCAPLPKFTGCVDKTSNDTFTA